MALRFLAVKLTKALPLRVHAGSRAFATAPKPKEVLDDLSRKIDAALDPTKYKSGREMFDTVQPLVVEKTRLSGEQYLKDEKVHRAIVVMTAVGCTSAVAYVARSL